MSHVPIGFAARFRDRRSGWAKHCLPATSLATVLAISLAISTRPVTEEQDFRVTDDPTAVASHDVLQLALHLGSESSPAAPNTPAGFRKPLVKGQSFVHHVKGGWKALLPDKNTADRTPRKHVFHGFEMIVHSTIEHVDEQRVIEVRHFERIWELTSLTDRELPPLYTRKTGENWLDVLAERPPHVGTRRIALSLLTSLFEREVASSRAGRPIGEAFWRVDQLSGKTVRLSHRAGADVESIQPLACNLTKSQVEWLRETQLCWDVRCLPRMGAEPHNVSAQLLRSILLPSMMFAPRGSLIVSKGQQASRADFNVQRLMLGSATDESSLDFGLVGSVEYRDDRVVLASLEWNAPVRFFGDFFPAGEEFRFAAGTVGIHPRVQLTYACTSRLVPSPDLGLHQVTAAGTQERETSVTEVNGHATRDARWTTVHLLQQLGSAAFTLGALSPAVAGMLLLSLFLCHYSARISRSVNSFHRTLIALIAVLLTIAFGMIVHGHIFLTQVIPVTDVIILGNWIPSGAAVLAGILSSELSIPAWRRTGFSFMLLGAGWCTIAQHTTAAFVPDVNRFEHGVCLQSTPMTCAACSTVTLLDYYGIHSSEQEMARLCLTSARGAPMLGIYRGLRLKTKGTRYNVVAAQYQLAELQRREMWPLLLPVRLDDTSRRGRGDSLLSALGHTNHCVILMGFTQQGTAIIADPAPIAGSGLAEWSLDQLTRCWTGEGIRVIAPYGPVER